MLMPPAPSLSGSFFGRLVDLVVGRVYRPALLRQYLRDRRRQRRLPVIDVPDRPHIAMRLRPLKLRLRHGFILRSIPLVSSHLGADFVRDRLGYLFVMVEMHGVLRTALAHRGPGGCGTR